MTTASLLLLLASAAAEEACTTPKLKYFDIRGRGEAIRMAFHDQGVEFVDDSFTSDEWGKTSPDGLKATWTAEGKLAFGQVPLLEMDGLKLVQSHTILRYMGRKYGWYSGTPEQLAKIDLVADGTEDVRKKLGGIRYSEKSDEEKAAMYTQYFTDPAEGKLWVGYLDKLVAASTTGFAASTADATHADYLLLDLLDLHDALGGEQAATLISTMPALTAFRGMMTSRPNLKKYLDGPTRRAN